MHNPMWLSQPNLPTTICYMTNQRGLDPSGKRPPAGMRKAGTDERENLPISGGAWEITPNLLPCSFAHTRTQQQARSLPD